VAYFYAAAAPRSRGALWPIFTPALIPLVLTFALRLFRGRWMFVTAGLGAASLPWFTGMVSRSAGSLRIGLGIPLLMLFAMAAALTFGMRRPSGTKTATPPEVPGA
jgi:fucose permease